MYKRIVSLVLGIAVVIGVMWFLGIENIIYNISKANLVLILMGFVVNFGMLFSLTLRLKLISNKYKKIAFLEAFRTVLLGLVINLLTPVIKMGGEPAKIYMLKKRGFTTSKSSAIVATDSLVEMLSMSFIVFISLCFILLTRQLPLFLLVMFFIALGVFVLIIGAFVTVLFNKVLLKKIVIWILEKISRLYSSELLEKFNKKDYIELFHKSFCRLSKNKDNMIKYFSVSLLGKFFEFARIWIILLAIGIVLPFHVVIYIWSIILILGMVPGLPGNLGVVEAGGAAAFVLFGISKGMAGSVIIVDRFISFWFILLLGAFVMWTKKSTIRGA